MLNRNVWSVALVMVGLMACGDSGDSGASTTREGGDSGGNGAEWTAKYTGDMDGAKGLLTELMGVARDEAATKSKALAPTDADYASLFANPEDAAKAREHFLPLWESGSAAIGPKPGQTGLLVWGATGAALTSGSGDAAEFPGGYRNIGNRLAPNVMFYRFKFVEPGKTTGMAFDGLAHVNGHWCIIPKPWRAFE